MTKPSRESTTTRALADLFDLIGRRWTLRILWELRGRTLSFNELRRAVGGMSQSVLVTGVAEFFGAGLVDNAPRGYLLTAEGRALVEQLAPLAGWADERDR